METVQTGPPRPGTPSSAERAWALLCHVSAFAGFFFPFGNVLGPLLVWMFKRDEMPLVREHGRESVNFQISFSVYAVIAAGLAVVLALVAAALLFPPGAAVEPPPEAPPGQWVLPAGVVFAPLALILLLILAEIAFVVIASLRAYQGLPWRYPLTLRLVK